jgi:alpha-L-fucosidase
MRYAVLTAKHVAGHCLWPSRHTDYSVANSSDKTDVVGAFVKSCERRGVRPAFYYDAYDNHHMFGQVNRSPQGYYPWQKKGWTTTYTTSLYQDFYLAQITELLTQYGPILEFWNDIPQLLGRGFRHFLYNHIAGLQPDALVMMNGRPLEVAWPTDIAAFERDLPKAELKWHQVEGRWYYIPGEYCNPIGKEWFFVEGDRPRSDQELLNIFLECRNKGVNFLLDVPPDKHGLIPDESRAALMRLRKNAKL